MIGSEKWAELFAKHDFFHKYKYYLQVIASSDCEDTQRGWSALVESRLRHLVLKLEFVENLNTAHPFIKGFDKTVVCYNEQQAIDAGRGIFQEASEESGTKPDAPSDQEPPSSDPKDTTEQQPTPQQPSRTVYTTTFYIGLAVEPKATGVNAPRKLDISWPTSEFTKMCKQWEKYDEKSMGICVKYIKSSSLPNDVFDEGEVRSKLKRGKSSNKTRTSQLMTQSAEQPFKKRRSNSINGEESTITELNSQSTDQLAAQASGSKA